MAGKRKNFFMVDNRIFEYGLKPRDIAVYCFLCRRMNRESNVAFPSRKRYRKRVRNQKRGNRGQGN